jgi:hypothetical protein
VIKLRVIRPVLYIAVLVVSMVGTYLFKLRTQGIFACTAEGYYASASAYLGYCNATAYGDYDHGAFWFDLEPEAVRFAADAQVLFLGSSRMVFGFSSQATDRWFASAGVSHYLLGFTHTENETFVAPLLAKLAPRAKVYVINVDQFFDDVETGPGSEILHDADVERGYKEKKLWQHLHRSLCTRVRLLCGHNFAYYRSREHGHWKAPGLNKPDKSLAADGPISDQDHWDHYAALARQFIANLPVAHACVLLTIVPSPATRSAEAKSIADAVGIQLVYPQLQGLRTFDGSHLDVPSAERWSQAFYDIAGPQIQRCLGQGAAVPDSSG